MSNESTHANGRIVQVKDVTKAFPLGDREITILKGISLTVHEGEFVAIVGPSGNGKSTLLNMITGIDHPTSGEVIVTGRSVHKMSENQLADWRGDHVGIIFQFFQMLPALSLLQNVILPMDFARKYSPREREARALDLLDSVGLADQAGKLPGRCRAASSSGRPSPAPWPTTPRWWWPMSRPATSIRTPPKTSSSCSLTWWRGARRWSWSPTTRSWRAVCRASSRSPTG